MIGNAIGVRTSPPPTTRTCLLRICHAKIREPPPWTSGNLSSAMIVSRPKEWSGDDGEVLGKF